MARNSSSPAALLEKLGSHSDPAVRRWVTRNANTPAQIAARLGAQFPAQLLENPAFDLYLLESPDLLEKVGIGALRSFLRRKNCPRGLFEYAVGLGDEIVQLSALQNAAAPQSVVESLAQSLHAAVRDAAALHVSISKATDLESARQHFDTCLVSASKEAKPTPTHNALAYLLTLPLPNKHHSEPQSPEEHLIIESAALEQPIPQSYSIRWFVAQNLSTPAEVLTRLVSDPDDAVRRAAAQNPAMSPRVLDILAGSAELKSYAAANPSMPVATLEMLASDEDRGVRGAVARNASTPIPVLVGLATDPNPFVRKFVAQNASTPITTLMSLMTPSLKEFFFEPEWHEFEKRVLGAAARPSIGGDTPQIQDLEKTLNADSLTNAQPSIAVNPSAPADVRDIATNDQPKTINSNIAPHAPMPLSKAILEVMATPENMYLRWVVAEQPSTSPELLKELSFDRNGNVRRAVAENYSTPADVLESLATDKRLDVRRGVAKNLSTPISIITMLATDKNRHLRQLVASNPSASATILAKLAMDSDASVRQNVATHPSTSVTALKVLAADERAVVRRSVAKNPSLPSSLLTLMAKDPNINVRQEAERIIRFLLKKPSSAPSLQVTLLKVLANSTDSSPRREVARHQLTPEILLKILSSDRDPDVRKAVAERHSTPEATLKKLATDPDTYVRYALAQNPSTPASVLAMLTMDQSPNVRQALAKHRSAPPAVLETLAIDPDNSVRVAIAENPSTPPRTLEYLAACVDASLEIRVSCAAALRTPDYKAALAKLRSDILRSLTAPGKSSYSRLLGFLLPDCPVASLARAQRSSSWLERCAIALHPVTPVSTLDKLAGDGNTIVRAVALERLKTMPAYANVTKTADL